VEAPPPTPDRPTRRHPDAVHTGLSPPGHSKASNPIVIEWMRAQPICCGLTLAFKVTRAATHGLDPSAFTTQTLDAAASAGKFAGAERLRGI
jgi:hypothetical protein